MVTHACNPSTLGSRGEWIMRLRDWDHPGQHGETPSLLKIHKLAGHGGAPVVPATWQVKAGELFEPGRRRLQFAVSRDCAAILQPGDWARLCLKKNKKSDLIYINNQVNNLYNGDSNDNIKIILSFKSWEKHEVGEICISSINFASFFYFPVCSSPCENEISKNLYSRWWY